jgi:hypothetical protein
MMVIVGTTFAVTLLAMVVVATLAALVVSGIALGRVAAYHHRVRVSRHESIPHYYGHLAVGH